jgi:tRNA threonylcarbamoyladenosine biosynthesis protein TsaE
MNICESLEETDQIGSNIAKKIKKGGILYLQGDLGSGKTTLTKSIAKALGINDFKIKSPTFNFIRKYGNLYHIDLYRVEEIDELLLMEIEEIMEDGNNIIIIEWAEKLEQIKLPKGIKIQMKYLDETSRSIEIEE